MRYGEAITIFSQSSTDSHRIERVGASNAPISEHQFLKCFFLTYSSIVPEWSGSANEVRTRRKYSLTRRYSNVTLTGSQSSCSLCMSKRHCIPRWSPTNEFLTILRRTTKSLLKAWLSAQKPHVSYRLTHSEVNACATAPLENRGAVSKES